MSTTPSLTGDHNSGTSRPNGTRDGKGGVGGKKKKNLALPAILLILGMLVMLYPVVTTVWNNYAATKAAQEYNKLEISVPQEIKDTQWEKAHRYNDGRKTGPILDPWLDHISHHSPDYEAYLGELNTTDAMARLIIPTIKTDLPVYHGTDESTLQKGLGHLYGSDLPVGGAGRHAIITGHTGLANATMFDHLKDVHRGDKIYVQVAGHKLKYVVDQIKVVLPHETDALRPEAGKDFLTLITCTPYGINTHRLLVRSHQEPLEPGEEQLFDRDHASAWQWWMYALISVVALVAAGSLRWLRRMLDVAHGGRTAGEFVGTESESTSCGENAITVPYQNEEN